MSAIQFDNEKYCLMVGADTFTGSFFTIWAQPQKEQDIPLVSVNNRGIEEYKSIPEIYSNMNELKATFERERRRGNERPNVDHLRITQIARKLGFEGVGRKIFEILD